MDSWKCNIKLSIYRNSQCISLLVCMYALMNAIIDVCNNECNHWSPINTAFLFQLFLCVNYWKNVDCRSLFRNFKNFKNELLVTGAILCSEMLHQVLHKYLYRCCKTRWILVRATNYENNNINETFISFSFDRFYF